MRLLFISSRDVNIKSHGGYQCTNRNYLSICELLGVDQVEVMDLSLELNSSFLSRFSKWMNYGLGFSAGISHKIIKKIIKKAKENHYVFIDSSQFGVLAYYLKKEKYNGTIICFSHNVEYNIQLERSKKNPFNFWRAILMYYNEKKALKHSDKIIALNKRDSDELKRIYKIKTINIYIIPISFSDTLEKEKDQPKELTTSPPTFLFIGNHWYPNIHGINWFVKNVLDRVDIKLQIVGIGMDVLKDKFKHPKIEFLGYVPDLKALIMDSDYMISPIFRGSGMKVKTCEALMYGKNIIGTNEAFEGYEIDHIKVGSVCNTKEEFIHAIKNCCSEKREKFNKYSRECFLEKYSFQATLKQFDELLIK